MKKIIDNIANWLVSLNESKDKIDRNTATFMKRGKNGFIVGSIILALLFLYLTYSVYRDYRSIWVALIPAILFGLVLFYVAVSKSYKEKMKSRNRSSRIKLVGFNMDFNERVLKKIYGSLTQYEYLDENLTRFQDFYNVLVLDFDEHDSALHFNCTQPQLKYILDKFKLLKKGVRFVSFERSEKIYHKGNLISAKVLQKKNDEFPPNYEFEQRVDAAFNFLGDI